MAERKRAAHRDGGSSHAWLWLLVLALAVVAAGAYWKYPQYFRIARLDPRHGLPSPIRSLRIICTANLSYQLSHPKIGYAKTLAALGPGDARYIDAPLASGEENGYRYRYTAAPGPSGVIDDFHVSARPLQYGGDTTTSAYMDDTCEIHTTREDRDATKADPIVK